MWRNRTRITVSYARCAVRLPLAAVAFMLLAAAGDSCCALPQQATPAGSTRPGSESNYDRLEERFPDLDSLRSELESEARLLEGVLPTQQPPTPPSPIADLLSAELETSRQVEELGNKMLQLMELQRQQRAMAQSQSGEPSPTDPNLPAPAGQGLAPSDPSAAIGPAQNEMGNGEVQPEDITPNLQTTTVLDQPPDQLAVADNMFYSGEYEMAQEFYRTALAQAPPGQSQIWIRFQLASCLKRTGEIGEAKQLLREIAGTQGAEEISENASWCVDIADRKQKLQENLLLIENYITDREPENDSNQ